MRCNNINVRFNIPTRIELSGDNKALPGLYFRDGNGVVYDVSAIEKSVDSMVGAPIVQYNKDGMQVPVGVVKSAKWNPAFCRIEVDGIILHGGTNEEVEMLIRNDEKIVHSMKVSSIGFGE